MERVSLTDQVVEALRGEILAGELPPGTSLREVALSERLDVARSTVREAIKALVAEGLVTHEMHRGALVTRHSAADVEDLLRARLVVEQAVADVCGTVAVPAAAEALTAMEAAVADEDWRAASSADLAFHRALVAAVGSARLMAFHAVLQGELRLLVVMADRTTPEENKVTEHRRLLRLVERGDADAYRAAAARHAMKSLPVYRRLLSD